MPQREEPPNDEKRSPAGVIIALVLLIAIWGIAGGLIHSCFGK